MLVGLIDLLFDAFILLLIIRVILSWVRPSIRDPQWVKALRILYEITEPVLDPIRRALPRDLPIDFSPMIAIFGLALIKRILIAIL